MSCYKTFKQHSNIWTEVMNLLMIRPTQEYPATIWWPHKRFMETGKDTDDSKQVGTRIVESAIWKQIRGNAYANAWGENRLHRFVQAYQWTEQIGQSYLIMTKGRMGLRGHSRKLKNETCLKNIKTASLIEILINGMVWEGRQGCMECSLTAGEVR